jgi:septal ring factor EnvC (AmiA/AmiB activator)
MKYKNTSGFRQMLVIAGNKTVVFADDVVEVSHELINPAFEKVADTVETTYKPRTIRKPSTDTDKASFLHLENKLLEVQKDTASVNEMAEAVTKISTLEQTIEESSSKHDSNLADLRKEFNEFKVTALKRFEILKNVVQTLEYELEQLYPEEEVNEESKPFRQ